MTKSKEAGDRGRQLAPVEERRRSQRVMIRTSVTLHATVQGRAVKYAATTLSVNDHGALVLAAQPLPTNTRVTLEHNRTHQRQDGRITRSPQESSGSYQIPIEFDKPAPGFWHISFPPPGAHEHEN